MEIFIGITYLIGIFPSAAFAAYLLMDGRKDTKLELAGIGLLSLVAGVLWPAFLAGTVAVFGGWVIQSARKDR